MTRMKVKGRMTGMWTVTGMGRLISNWSVGGTDIVTGTRRVRRPQSLAAMDPVPGMWSISRTVRVAETGSVTGEEG